MDKYEYKVRSEEIVRLIDEEKYSEAANVADTVDWRRVKSVSMLLKIAALYTINRRNEDSRAILLLAYERYPSNRSVVYSLCEVSIELDDVVAAIEYYKQYAKIAPKDIGVITLRYRILEAQEASLEERIALLEELKKRDYQEEWAYELAYLYHRIGLATKCVEECDDIILWFGDGPYVMKAMELKQLHVPLTDVQQAKYDIMLGNAQDNYADDEYGQGEEYAGDGYEQEYAEGEEYAGGGYEQEYAEGEEYADGGYEQEYAEGEEYADGGYEQEYAEGEECADDGYDRENYPEYDYSEYNSENNYSDEYYTDDFYTEQTYDENGNPVTYEEAGADDEPAQQPAFSTEDMSLYNTINLQKVVAEGMKELFSDNENILAREQEELLSTEPDDLENGLESEPDDEEPEEPEAVHTGKVAMMTDGVSEAAPAPNTGAVKKVILPGDNARFIKTEPDMDELRDTTERSVNEEHTRMEANSENIYQDEARLMDMETADEPDFRPMTGQMNIDDVLSEWESIKLNNAKKHQEEIKQQVLTQTGKILASFDSSLKNGILGELDKDGEADGFLAADVTGDIPDTQMQETNDDDYDVSYVAPDTKEQLITDLEAAVAKELGATRVIPQEEIKEELAKEDSETASDEPLYDEAASDGLMYEDADYVEAQEPAADYAEAEAPDDEEPQTPGELDPEDAESIAETAKEDALRTQEIKMNTADLSSLSERIEETTQRETTGARREEIREFTAEERKLFENFAVTKKIKRQILFALENMTLASFTGNVIITGDTGMDTVRMAKNLIREFQAADGNFSGKVAKITGEKFNQKDLKDVFEKLNNGAIIIEKANGMTQETLYELAALLNQDNLGIVVIMEDTKKEITRLLEKQAMAADYFNIRIDLMEMDNNALVAYAKNYALALEYSIDELGVLALYTRIANIQSGNHVVTKDEVREIIDEAIWKSKKSKLKNFVDVLFARRYDSEDMIVLKERDFM